MNFQRFYSNQREETNPQIKKAPNPKFYTSPKINNYDSIKNNKTQFRRPPPKSRKTNKIRKHRKKHTANQRHRKNKLKREICKYYLMGNCNKGAGCQFSHEGQPGNKNILCRYHLVNACQKGKACLLSHEKSRFPCKYFFISGKCDKFADCEFSHGVIREKQILENFIEENLENMFNHHKNQIWTPFLDFVRENGYFVKFETEEKSKLERKERQKNNLPEILKINHKNLAGKKNFDKLVLESVQTEKNSEMKQNKAKNQRENDNVFDFLNGLIDSQF